MIDWNKRNGGFLDDFHVREFQVSNLSKQIDELKEELEEEKRINQEDLKYIDELNDRIEKAVEYIKVNNSEWKWSMFGRDDLLNILNSGSDE